MNTVSLRHAPPGQSAQDHSTNVLFVSHCGSTNEEVWERKYSGLQTPWALATFDQRAGRGRQGRAWVNRVGDSLALTVVLRPAFPREEWGWLTLAAALAAQEVIGGVGIKWPNDIVTRDRRKVAGILAQVRGEQVALGIGVNLRGQIEASDPHLVRAATVAEVSPEWAERLGDSGGCEDFARCLAQRIAIECGGLELSDKAAESTRSRYAVNCITLGCDVWVDTHDKQPQVQRAHGIDRYGQLLVGKAGALQALSAADVHLIPPPVESQTPRGCTEYESERTHG